MTIESVGGPSLGPPSAFLLVGGADSCPAGSYSGAATDALRNSRASRPARSRSAPEYLVGHLEKENWLPDFEFPSAMRFLQYLSMPLGALLKNWSRC